MLEAPFHGFSAHQVARLLRFIYHPQLITPAGIAELRQDLAPLLRLAHKLDIPILVEAISKHVIGACAKASWWHAAAAANTIARCRWPAQRASYCAAAAATCSATPTTNRPAVAQNPHKACLPCLPAPCRDHQECFSGDAGAVGGHGAGLPAGQAARHLRLRHCPQACDKGRQGQEHEHQHCPPLSAAAAAVRPEHAAADHCGAGGQRTCRERGPAGQSPPRPSAGGCITDPSQARESAPWPPD